MKAMYNESKKTMGSKIAFVSAPTGRICSPRTERTCEQHSQRSAQILLKQFSQVYFDFLLPRVDSLESKDKG